MERRSPPRMVTRHEGGTECHILLLLREIFESEYKVRLADIFNSKTFRESFVENMASDRSLAHRAFVLYSVGSLG